MDLKLALNELALQDRRTLSSYIALALEEHVKKEREKQASARNERDLFRRQNQKPSRK